MFGAFIGDIIGSTYEFSGCKDRNFKLFPHSSSFTDDSVMTVAIGDALMYWRDFGGDLKTLFVETMRNYGKAYPYPEGGYGSMFAGWLESDTPHPYNSYGNGSAMRVSPCGLMAQSLEEALDLAKQSAEVTHNHPEGVKGAQATAAAVYLAKNGASKKTIRDYIHTNFYSLDWTLDAIRSGYHFDGTCQGSVPESIQAFLESFNYEAAIRNVVSLGGDADTMGAITGSIAWAYYGRNGMTADMKLLWMQAKRYIPEELIARANDFQDFCIRIKEAELEQIWEAPVNNQPIYFRKITTNGTKEAEINNRNQEEGREQQETAPVLKNTAAIAQRDSGKKADIDRLSLHWDGEKDYIRELITKHNEAADRNMARDKGLFSNDVPNEHYFRLYWIYRNLFDCFLKQTLNLTYYNRRIADSGLRFIPVKRNDMDIHQYLSTMGLSFFYLRNELYVEKLSPADIDTLLGLTAWDVLNPKPATTRIIERTWKTVIDSNVEPGTIGMSRYGPDSDNFWFESDQLVIGFRHDDFADNGLGENEAWDKNNELQIDLISAVLKELRTHSRRNMNQTVNFIWYNDYTIAETVTGLMESGFDAQLDSVEVSIPRDRNGELSHSF